MGGCAASIYRYGIEIFGEATSNPLGLKLRSRSHLQNTVLEFEISMTKPHLV